MSDDDRTGPATPEGPEHQTAAYPSEPDSPEQHAADSPQQHAPGRFSRVAVGGRVGIAAAAVAVLLLLGAGAAGFAVAGAGDDDGRGGADRDRTGQGRDGGGRGDRVDRAGDGGGDGGGDADETASVTAVDLAQVAEAVEAEYPGATVERTETEQDGTFEAHVTTTDGDRLRLELDDAYAVTDAQTDPGADR